MEQESIQNRVKDIPLRELILSALEARKKAYAPYSSYGVGAAVLTGELRIYKGCNIENAAYSPGICAERVAVSKAVSEGARQIKAIAIAGSPLKYEKKEEKLEQYAFPCGVCRQFLREFCDPVNTPVIVAKSLADYRIYLLEELLPESFGPGNLQ